MPRVTNAAVAIVLTLCMLPVFVTWGDRTTVQRVFLGGMIAFVGLFILLCATAALRPGALGRAARKGRERSLAKRAQRSEG